MTSPPLQPAVLSTDRPVAVLGLGAMGTRVAIRMLDAQVPVRVWNRTPAAAAAATQHGATAADTVEAAVRGAALVLVCVRDDAASEALWEAALPALPEESYRVDLSTISPAHARRLGDRLGGRFLEAPMVGSRPQVDAGRLQLLVGGDARGLDAVRPVLETFAGAVHHVGAVGHAAVLKLVVNGLLAAQLAVAGELLEVLRRSGVELGPAADLLAGLPVTAPALARSLPRILAGEVSPNFPLDLAAKDLRYLRADAGPAPVLAAVGDALDRAARDDGARDIVALAVRPAAPGTAAQGRR